MSYPTIVLFSAAITVVFTQGSIFKALREHGPKLWRELVSCALCSGVWIGAFSTVLLQQIPLQEISFPVLFLILGMGSLTGCLAMLFVAVWDALDATVSIVEGLTAFVNGFSQSFGAVIQKHLKSDESRDDAN